MSLERYRAECDSLGCVEFYDRLITEGNNPGFAAMLAQRRPPGTKGTDRSFLEGSHDWSRSMGRTNRRHIFAEAKKAGISTQGKVYKGGIGKPNDPMAWVSSASDVLAACKEKGFSCQGAVNYKAPERQIKKKRLADDLAHGYMQRELASDPSLREKVKKNPKKLIELKEKVIDKHGSKKR